MYLPEESIATTDELCSDYQPFEAYGWDNAGQVFEKQGKYEEAERMYQKSLAIREKQCDDDSIYLARNLEKLADTLFNLGVVNHNMESEALYLEAEDLYQQALEIMLKRYGDDYPDLVHSLEKLGDIADATHNWALAEHYYRRAVTILIHHYGESHPKVPELWSQIAETFRFQDKSSDDLYKKINDWSYLHKTEDLHMHIAYAYLAERERAYWHYFVAEKLYRASLVRYLQLYDEEHPRVAYIWGILAYFLNKEKKYKEAELFSKRAIEVMVNAYGENDYRVADDYEHLAIAVYHQGNLDDAEAYHQKALAIRLTLYKKDNSDHPDIASSYYYLSLVFAKKGRYKEAEDFSREALAIRLTGLFESSPDIARSWDQLASVLYHQKKYKESEKAYRKALNVWSKHDVVEDNQDLIDNRRGLINVLIAQGEEKDIAMLKKELINIQKKKNQAYKDDLIHKGGCGDEECNNTIWKSR